MNRIDRLAAILIQLQSRPLVKAQDISDKFSISLRTVYRDVHALEEAGVPVIGEAGIGYRLMEGYKLPPLMFTSDEMSAMLTASKLMQTLSDQNSSKYYLSALDKIKAVLRLNEKYHVEDIKDHVAVIARPAFANQCPDDLYLQKILMAISNSKIIEMKYFSSEKNELLQRKVEPVGIYYQGNYWYLVAFCLLRNDYRNFRTDKIQALEITNTVMEKEHAPLQDFINRVVEKKQLFRVVIDVEKDIVKYFGEQKYYNGFVKDEYFGERVRMTFLTSSLQGFARWFMLYGDKATIIEPLELNDMAVVIAESILKKIEENQILLT